MKKSLATRWLIGGACAVLVLFVFWVAFAPPVELVGSEQTLGLRAAAGDTNAVAALRKAGSSAVPALVRLLEYQEPFLRQQARALAPRLPRRLSQALLLRVGSPDAPRVRAAGAQSLGLLGAKAGAAVPALLQHLRDPEQYVAMEAATALGRIGAASVPGLTRALADKDPVVRHAAAYALGELGPAAESSIPSLIETLADRDGSVRSSTAYSLGLIGTRRLLH